MLQGRGVALISEVRGTEMSNVAIIIIIIIIIIIFIYVCIIDNFFLLSLTFNWLRNKIHCWTITNNLSSIIFLINIFTNVNFMVMIQYSISVYILQTLFSILSQNKAENIFYSFCTVINAVSYHCIIHIYYLEKTGKTHKPYLLHVLSVKFYACYSA